MKNSWKWVAVIGMGAALCIPSQVMAGGKGGKVKKADAVTAPGG